MSWRVDPSAYVLGLVDREELEEARRLERDDPRFAAEVRALTTAAGRLGALGPEEWDAGGPPPLRLDEATAPATVRRPSRGLAERLRALRPPGAARIGGAWAAAAAALLVALIVAGALLLQGGSGGTPTPPTRVIALERFGDGPAGAAGRATVARIGGVPEVTLDTSGLRPSAPGSRYEVWMIHDARRMVSLGTFTVGRDGRATVTLPVTADPARYPIMDVSLEPVAGPASHSGHSVLRSASRRA